MTLKIVGMMVLLAAGVCAQEIAPVAPTDGFARVAGVDERTGIAYVLLSMEGKVVSPVGVKPEPPPRLTAQCTKHPDGKLKFELLADAGGVAEVRYIAPYKPKKDEPDIPREAGVMVTMEFLGYVKEKPVKRAWRLLRDVPGEMRYDTPGLHSSNLEEIMFYMQYLKALPRLRLTIAGEEKKPPTVVEFETLKWQGRVKAEPMCWASAL